MRKSVVCFLAIIFLLACSCAYVTCSPVAQNFDLTRVRLLPGIFKDAQDRNEAYLLTLEPDRFLHMFRQTAGLTAPSSVYGGWELETSELRGHAGGHYLSACALAYAGTGNVEFKNRADYMVAQLAMCQAVMPSPGYLSAFPESFIDRVETGQGVWAPYYTLHKIAAGLFDAYQYCGNQQALSVLSGMASWCKNRCDKLTETQMQNMLNTEFGGMAETFANLYSVTGNPAHLAIAQRFDKKWFTDPLVLGTDNLPGIHSNTHIPQVIASARLFELTGTTRYESIAEHFWDICTGAHCYPTGGTSNGEYWQAANTLSTQFGDSSEESCCTYNMLKLANHMLTWNAEARVGDYCERALLNHVLTFQYAGDAMPQYAGMCSYYTSFIGGHWKKFSTPYDNMWCCTGTGFEDHARYGESIYFHNGSTLWVNLFIASELNWSEKGVTVRQDTQFPSEQGTTLTIHTAQPQSLSIRVRIPYWATNGVNVQVNGQVWTVNAGPSTFAEITRTWSEGDTIHVTFPMSLRLERFVDNSSIAAVFYGPVLLSGALGTANFSPSMQWGGGFSDVVVPKMAPTSETLTDWITPTGSQPMTFTAQGMTQPITLMPFYKLFDQRYNLYWKIPSGPIDPPISALAGKPDGTPVSYQGKPVTFAPRGSAGQRTTNFFYIEDLKRAAAIRVEGPSVGYDNVRNADYTTITGNLRTKLTTGERYIELTAVPSSYADTAPASLAMNTKAVHADPNTLAKFVTVAGKVKDAPSNGSFTITDGYMNGGTQVATKVIVTSGATITNLAPGNMVSVTGVISKEGNTPESAVRVILMNKYGKLYPRDIAPFAKYMFDETSGTSAIDSWGGRNGTLVNGPTRVTGKYSKAVNLDGTNDYVTLPSGIVSGLDSFTIAMWVNLDTVTNWTRIFDFGTGTGVNMFLTPRASTGVIRFAITINGSGSEQQINGTAALTSGSWQHVAVTMAGNTGILYVNGVEVGRNTGMGLKPSSLGNTTANYIGKSQYGDPYLDGQIDDFRIYGEALNQAEITQLCDGLLN